MDTHTAINLLSLDQPCLEKIIRYLDCSSFLSLSLTCKKLSSLLHSPSIWNDGVLYWRAVHLLHSCVFSADKGKSLSQITDVLTKATDQSKFMSFVNPGKIIETWTKCGPVFGKLHSLVSLHEEKGEDGEPRPLCSMNHRFITLELPSGKLFKIQYSTFWDGTWAYGNQEALKAVIDPIHAIYNDQPGSGVLNWRSSYWHTDDETQESEDINCLNAIGKLLEEEIGEVAPGGLEGELIKEFAEMFPQLEYCSSKGITFKNDKSNKLDEANLKAQYLKKRQYIVSEFRKRIKVDNIGDEQQDAFSKAIREFTNVACILMVRGDCTLLQNLNTAFDLFNKVNRQFRYNKNTAAKDLFRSLLFRVDFGSISGDWGPANIADKYVYCKMDFKLCGSHKLFVKAESSTTGESYPDYFEQAIKFSIPTLNINVTYNFKSTDPEEADSDEPDPVKAGKGLSRLSPITAEIQKCVDKDCPNAQVTNAIVAFFFVSVSEISHAFDIDEMEEECLAEENLSDSPCSDSD